MASANGHGHRHGAGTPHQHHRHPDEGGGGLSSRGQRRLLIVMLLTASYMVAEALGGWWTGSLALLSDAGHMVTDGAALALGAFAAWVGRRPPSAKHSYGLGRVEIFAALVNAVAMLAIVGALAYEAIARLQEAGPAIKGEWAALIALAGLALNLLLLR